MMKSIFTAIIALILSVQVHASYILIPMDLSQKDHLKAYGIAYWVLQKEVEAYWMLNYRGGSFAFKYAEGFEVECRARGVTFEVIPDAAFIRIREEISTPDINQEVIKLEVAPRVAVYSPEATSMGELEQPWDDAVTLALRYAEIPFDFVYDEEILDGKLAQYDWLHLHHEDFTGQFGKSLNWYRAHQWFRDHVEITRQTTYAYGYSKVSEMKLAVAVGIREYVGGGGFMFAMCSATDTYEVALAASETDICPDVYDGDPIDPQYAKKLNYDKTFAFSNFQVYTNPREREFSSIDMNRHKRQVPMEMDYFTLFDFSAKWDPVPSMLTQNHTRTVKGFMGQTTAFDKRYIKSHVLIMGENKPASEARYIHGSFGEGTWTYYGGHDPEDYVHRFGEPDTDLHLHPNSPGYRLILNNVLFPAAKKKKRKT